MNNRPDKAVMTRNFSQYAHLYDRNNDIQNETAQMLAKRLPNGNINTILEIGCGTGNYTGILRKTFKESRIKAIDISDEMVRIAKEKLADGKTKFLKQDAETINFKEKFDLITSNAALHWLNDFDKTIGKLQRLLTESGAIVFSIFGPNTFAELKKSVESAAGKEVPMTSDLFHSKENIENILKKYFKDVRITERFIGQTHVSLEELLKKIKYSGTRGNGAGLNKIWSPDLLNKIEAKYCDRFGAIEATYQVFFCEAQCKT